MSGSRTKCLSICSRCWSSAGRMSTSVSSAARARRGSSEWRPRRRCERPSANRPRSRDRQWRVGARGRGGSPRLRARPRCEDVRDLACLDETVRLRAGLCDGGALLLRLGTIVVRRGVDRQRDEIVILVRRGLVVRASHDGMPTAPGQRSPRMAQHRGSGFGTYFRWTPEARSRSSVTSESPLSRERLPGSPFSSTTTFRMGKGRRSAASSSFPLSGRPFKTARSHDGIVDEAELFQSYVSCQKRARSPPKAVGSTRRCWPSHGLAFSWASALRRAEGVL